ncbi:MAG: acetylxylan esterase [Dehalococcoidia bacterium]
MNTSSLDNFWNNTIEELHSIAMSEELVEDLDSSARDYNTYKVVLSSFEAKKIRGIYSVPTTRSSKGIFPAILRVPGYSATTLTLDKHFALVLSGFTVLSLWPRGQGESTEEWSLEHSTKLTYHIEDKEKYYYRGAYMDCVRGIDFLASRPEVDKDAIGMWGRSQGGGYTLATASLDARLAAVVAEQPFLSNYPTSSTLSSTPYVEITDYIKEHSDQTEKILDTLSYFDTLNLVKNITCPVAVNIGMIDPICPPETIMPVFEKIPALKNLTVYQDLAHESCADFNVLAMDWLKKYLD